jgi:glycosyltransferase involved in cell wall biosynthesis
MIEAMACGTPVLAFRNGAVCEVVDEGVTGHVVDVVEEAVRALERVIALDRGCVRRRFEERFSVNRMARDYVSAYQRLTGEPAVRASDSNAPPATARANGGGAVH